MAKKLARPIKTERDHKGAALAAKKLRASAGKESAAERRLQALIREMEKFDSAGEDPDDDTGDAAQDVYGVPGRRWSDDSSS